MCCNSNGCGGGGCKCITSKVIYTLVLIGGVNWGLVGAGMLFGGMGANWNLVSMIFGSMPTVEAIVYLLVGVAAVSAIVGCKCKKCKDGVCSVHGADMTGKVENTAGKM
jgi:uncharacterized protein